MAKVLDIKLDLRSLEGLSERIDQFSSENLGQAIVKGLNETLDTAYDLSVRSMTTGVNLNTPYVESRLQRVPATKDRPVAEVVAPFRDRSAFTLLSHYGAMVGLQPVKNPERAKGNEAFGIPKGLKQSNPTVQVVRGATKQLKSRHAFLIPTKKDSEGNPLVFKRNPNTDKLDVLYGPSVYQLFRTAIDQVGPQVSDDLAENLARIAADELEKTL